MSYYKVQLKQGSRTIIEHVEAAGTAQILNFYSLVSTMKVTEILKIEYQASDNVIPVDDFNYTKIYKGFVKNIETNIGTQYIVHNIKPTINENEIADAIMANFKIDGLKIDSVYCSLMKDS